MSPRRWMAMVGVLAVTIFVTGEALGAQAALPSRHHHQPQPHQFVEVDLLLLASVPVTHALTTTATSPSTTSTFSTTSTTSTTSPPAVLASTPVTPETAPAPAPAPALVLPAYGHATEPGCAAALAYLQAYAAPGFALDCPGYAEGHEAMTCIHGTPAYPDACPNGPEIAIADACPAASMNEAANSWNLTGQLSTEQQKFGASYASIDPFGAC